MNRMNEQELRAELEKEHGKCFGWALSCCGHDPAEAEEVLQAVYVKILAGRARFNGQSSFKTWLLALIRHTAVDEWRRKKRQLVLSSDGEASIEQLAHGAGPDETLDRVEMQNVLGEALARLSARQQQVLRLVFYHDLSLADAAAVIGVSLGSVRTHYERGKERLREWFEANKMFDERR